MACNSDLIETTQYGIKSQHCGRVIAGIPIARA